jgi:hypothetical protein
MSDSPLESLGPFFPSNPMSRAYRCSHGPVVAYHGATGGLSGDPHYACSAAQAGNVKSIPEYP